MKKRFLPGVLVCLLAFGFVFTTCNNGSDGDDTTIPKEVKYESTDTDGNTYSLIITENTSRAYTPAKGDLYELIIFIIASHLTSTSKGTIFSLAGGVFTLQPSYTGSTPFNVTISNGQMTAITGAIAVEQGDPVPPPSGPLTPEEIKNFAGSIGITPNSNVNINTELTAVYNGTENVTLTYQWKKDGANVGTNSNKYTPTAAGSYTVTISAKGYNPKTSAAVTVTAPGGGGTTNVVGTWEYEMTRKEFAEIGDMPEGILEWMGIPAKFVFLRLVLNADKTYTMYENDLKTDTLEEDETGTYEVVGNTITLTMLTSNDDDDKGPLPPGTISGNKITINTTSKDTGKPVTVTFIKK